MTLPLSALLFPSCFGAYQLSHSVLTTSSGIIGLYTGAQLLKRGIPGSQIEYIAEFLPGDESIRYTSPYAGGNFSCITGNDPETLIFDKFTYCNLQPLLKKLGGPKAGLERTPSTEYWDKKPPKAKINSLKSYLIDYREIPSSELPKGTQFGIRFLSWSFNCPKFLLSLRSYLEANGVKFTQKKLTHVSQAFLPGTKIVFNCTGLGARSLGGVEDTRMYPTRGQVLVVKAPHVTENVMRWGSDYATYIIKRPYSDDQLILGGFMQKDDWRAETFQNQNIDIIQRTSKLFPELLSKNPKGSKPEDLEVLRSAAGLRPSRHGGVRIERENSDEGKVVIHNYGASGYGYQAGLGMAEKSIRLALDTRVAKL